MARQCCALYLCSHAAALFAREAAGKQQGRGQPWYQAVRSVDHRKGMHQLAECFWGLHRLMAATFVACAVAETPQHKVMEASRRSQSLQEKDANGKEQPKESLLQLLVKNVLKNPYIWGMALTYFFIYVVRQGVTSWFVFYLIKVGSSCSVQCGSCRGWGCAQVRLEASSDVSAAVGGGVRLGSLDLAGSYIAVRGCLYARAGLLTCGVRYAGQGCQGCRCGCLPSVRNGAGWPLRQPACWAHQ